MAELQKPCNEDSNDHRQSGSSSENSLATAYMTSIITDVPNDEGMPGSSNHSTAAITQEPTPALVARPR